MKTCTEIYPFNPILIKRVHFGTRLQDGDGEHLHSANKNEKMNYLTEMYHIFNVFIFVRYWED